MDRKIKNGCNKVNKLNLIIDVGNSSTKAALMCDGQIVEQFIFDGSDENERQMMVDIAEKAKDAIIAASGERQKEIVDEIKKIIPKIIHFNHLTPIPIANKYETPQTLGMDRLAAAVGAWTLKPGKELMIFDFGTALTIDRVSAMGEYMGGNISPGLSMRFEALNKFTAKLPLIQVNEQNVNGDNMKLVGKNTTEALIYGTWNSMLFEIEGYLKNMQKQTEIFFTGREAHYFVKSMKKTIFADQLLTLKGLEKILMYNNA